MSETLHTVKSKSINVNGNKVHTLSFACMSTDYFNNYNGCKNKINRVCNQWESRTDTPKYLVAVFSDTFTGKPTPPKEGDMVYEVSGDREFQPVLSDRQMCDSGYLTPVGYLYKEGRSWAVSSTSSKITSFVSGLTNPKKIEVYTEVRGGKEEQITVKEYRATNYDYVSYPNTQYPKTVNLVK